MIRPLNIPKEIRAALTILENAGFEGFLVGGCVRDILLGRSPADWDITTNAGPTKIQEFFPNSFYENKFGTVSVVTGSEDPKLRAIEITPYRIEGKYSDKRHPDEIRFAKTIEEDLGRRDFTANAIAMNSSLEIIDPFGGQKDLEKKGIYIKAVSMSGLAEEAGLAYKKIDSVADSLEQVGISKRVIKLSPIGNIKG